MLLNEVCHDVTTESMLSHVADKNLLPTPSNTKDETRVDLKASSFWIKSQKT